MSFSVAPDAYDRFMGRYSRQLAPVFAREAGIGAGSRVLDVGCGPGALTEVLAGLAGAGNVAAADPSPGFAAACAERIPGADVREAPAEALPWPDAAFDAALAQLVLGFMADPGAGVGEMRRVVVPGGTVAACTWDGDGGMAMLRLFWEAARAVREDMSAPDSGLRFGTEAELAELWTMGGLADVEVRALEVTAAYEDFDDFWTPFLAGVGPAGAWCVAQPQAVRDAVRDALHGLLGAPAGPFELGARAWMARGRVV